MKPSRLGGLAERAGGSGRHGGVIIMNMKSARLQAFAHLSLLMNHRVESQSMQAARDLYPSQAVRDRCLGLSLGANPCVIRVLCRDQMIAFIT